eukprot:1145617-Pelagomonas_calceolata.AAC.2
MLCCFGCRSSVKILEATGDLYAAVVDDKLVVKLGPAEWDPQAKGIQLGGGKQPKLAVTGFQHAPHSDCLLLAGSLYGRLRMLRGFPANDHHDDHHQGGRPAFLTNAIPLA